MFPSRDRIGNWNSNGRLSIYLFLLVFGVYIVLDIVSIVVKGPAPDGLIPIVTAAFGFAVTMNSADRRVEAQRVERQAKEVSDKADETAGRADDLESFAEQANPDVAKKTIKSKKQSGGEPDAPAH